MAGLGNEVQARLIAEQVAVAAVEKYVQQHPPKAEIPAPLKWAGGIVAAVASLAVTGGVGWGVTTLSQLKDTVTRIDERQQIGVDDRRETKLRLEKIEERLGRIERQPEGAR